jgi:Zinc knuckle
LEEKALFGGQYKGKCRNCGQIGHKAAQYKKKHFNHVGNNGNMTEGNYCTYCCRTGHVKKNCFKLKKKELRNSNRTFENETLTDETAVRADIIAISKKDS